MKKVGFDEAGGKRKKETVALEQTERNLGRSGVFSLVAVAAYSRGENTPESSDGGHYCPTPFV